MIVQKAVELWKLDRMRANDPSFDINPEVSELQESGYLNVAQSELMRDNNRAHVNEWKDYDAENFADFQFDVETGLQQGTFISGGRGTGKSSLAKTVVSMFQKRGCVVKVFDNSQVWRQSNIPNLVIVKPYSNIETEYNLSCVFDTSFLSVKQQKTFIENMIERDFEHTVDLSEKERNWRIYVLEECELLLSTHERSKPIMKLCALGRNYMMSYVAIAQRFQMVSTDLISLSGQLYIGALHEENDRKKLKNWLGKRTEELKTLEVGQFIHYRNGKIFKMQVEPFSCGVEPKLITMEPHAKIQPIPTLPKTNSGGALKPIIMSTLLLLAICYGLSQMLH
jgi:hypothetical protein